MFRTDKFSIIALMVVALFTLAGAVACNNDEKPAAEAVTHSLKDSIYTPPDTSTIPHDQFGDMVRYGRDLVVNTAHYIGPNGTVGHYLGNKMNCINCHLDAGTRPFGFNFFSAHARYPQYRGRENQILTLAQRINNCIERPHSGLPLPLGSKEIVAMVCYMKWLAYSVPVGEHVKGDDLLDIEFPDRAADPKKGATIYATNCASCHGPNGQGQWNADSSTYIYPPLWGPESFQKGSSPSRVIKLAQFVKANMPYLKATWQKPILTDDEALDVAAFINDDDIHSRPHKKNINVPDYPNILSKAIDYDKGPFADSFSEQQHKYGPYKPIIAYWKAHNQHIVY